MSARPAWILLGTVTVLGGLVWTGGELGGWFRGDEDASLAGVEVLRGPLRISVTERGNLKAADSVSIKSEIEGSTTVLWIVSEGEIVQEGDLLCELDVAHLSDDEVQQEIAYRNAEAAFVKAKKQHEIQVIQNESDVAQAEQRLDFALQDIKKYLEADKLLAEEKAQEDITLAEEELERARDKVEWSDKLAARGFLTQTELEADRLSLTRAEIQLEQYRRTLAILVDYEVPREIEKLQAEVDEARRDLERVQLQAAAKLVDYEKGMQTSEAMLELEEEKLAKQREQISKARVLAPKAGMVVYSQDPGRRWGGQQPMGEGAQVRERQEIMTIPNPGGMIAQASLHESVLKQVHPDLECLLQVDALPGQLFRGRVDFVAVLPDQNSWWANPNTRLYRTDIQIHGASDEMRPGMSCSVEILVEDLEDCLHVPVQAVFRDGGESICFVVEGGRPDRRSVEAGRYNDRWVEIVSGLDEGEIVMLSPPPGFTPAAEPEAQRPERPEGTSGRPGAGEGRDGAQGAARAGGAGKRSSSGGRPAATSRGGADGS